MSTRYILPAGLGLLALGFVATAAEAAPVTGVAGATAVDAAGAGLVEKTTGYGYRYGGYGGYYGRPYRPFYGYGYYPRRYGFYGYNRGFYPRYGYHRYRRW